MTKVFLLLTLLTALGACGCNKQEKINSQKIDLLSQKLIQMDLAQARQMTLLQAQLTLLAPQLDKMNSTYFEKNRDDALFFHTNTLYLLLTIGKQIEARLQTDEANRSVEDAQAYSYHTNDLEMTYLCTEQIQAALTAQETRIEENLNEEIKSVAASLQDSLQKQITQAATPDPAEIAWRKQIEAEIAQIQRSLDALHSPPAAPSSSPVR